MISFKAQLQQTDMSGTIPSCLLVSVPKPASDKLPSRGMTMVEGTLNGLRIRVLLQPDGKASHWFKLNKAMLATLKIQPGDIVELAIAPIKDWPEPKLPASVQNALAEDPEA